MSNQFSPGSLRLPAQGEAKQFGVKGNSPDPATVNLRTLKGAASLSLQPHVHHMLESMCVEAKVSKAGGIVKYELVDIDYTTATGQFWDRHSYLKGLKGTGGSDVRGVALVQMLEDRKIKFESFPGKTAQQVSGFTSSAKIYER